MSWPEVSNDHVSDHVKSLSFGPHLCLVAGGVTRVWWQRGVKSCLVAEGS